MIIYEIIGAIVVLGLIGLGVWKASEFINRREARRRRNLCEESSGPQSQAWDL